MQISETIDRQQRARRHCNGHVHGLLDVDLVHWWASRGEKVAFEVLKGALQRSGIACSDTSIAGGASMMQSLDARLAEGDVPTGTVTTGYGTRQWLDQNEMADLSDLVHAQGWDKVIPKPLKEFCIWQGRWIGVPASLHSINWLWLNNQAANKIGLEIPFADLEALFDALARARDVGLVPLAIGGEAWLVATVFDSLSVATNGYAFYRQALEVGDMNALTSPKMVKAFRNLARLGTFTDPGWRCRDWSEATNLVAQGDALLEISGDWVTAELKAAGKLPCASYTGVRFPGTEGGVLFNGDIIVMFDTPTDTPAARHGIAKTVMCQQTQSAFNRAKGAVPARLDVRDDGFDVYGRASFVDVHAALETNTLIGSMAHGYMQPPDVQAKYLEIAMKVFVGDLSPENATNSLATAFATSLRQ